MTTMTTPITNKIEMKIRGFRSDDYNYVPEAELHKEVHHWDLDLEKVPNIPAAVIPSDSKDWLIDDGTGKNNLIRLHPDQVYKSNFIYVPTHLFQRKRYNVREWDLANAPRDADKLRRLLEVKQRQKEKADHIEDTQRLVTEKLKC